MKLSRRLARKVMWLAGDKTQGGIADPPGSWIGTAFGPPDDGADNKPMFVASTGNDGYELWLGYWHAWKISYPTKEARHLAWWILWHWWARQTWFGLRRWVYYKALIAAHE